MTYANNRNHAIVTLMRGNLAIEPTWKIGLKMHHRSEYRNMRVIGFGTSLRKNLARSMTVKMSFWKFFCFIAHYLLVFCSIWIFKRQFENISWLLPKSFQSYNWKWWNQVDILDIVSLNMIQLAHQEFLNSVLIWWRSVSYRPFHMVHIAE